MKMLALPESLSAEQAGGWGLAPLQIEAELDKTGKVVSRFVYGNGINVPELVVRPAENKGYQVITDHLGSPVLVVNVTNPEDVMMAAHYDAWGVATLDETASADGSWPIPHGFAGGLYDEDTGFVRFGVRDYDPRVGRWTGKDPILFNGGRICMRMLGMTSSIGSTQTGGRAGVILPALKDGEEVLWQGRPVGHVRLRAADRFWIPQTLMISAILLLGWVVSVAGSSASTQVVLGIGWGTIVLYRQTRGGLTDQVSHAVLADKQANHRS